ncbi:unnamed protein product [Rhizophagus irregularis]|nr:unnamed protein product [Rhizophagus irregularis]
MVWSDESRFALFQSDGRARVWRSPRETYNKDCIQSTDKFGGGSQDGASCHTSTYTVWWMRTHNIPILDWVAQSPDLNPIENLWNHLDSQVRKRKPVPRSKQELIEVIQDEWRKITIETCQRLILSMPNGVKAVIKAKGGHTKY